MARSPTRSTISGVFAGVILAAGRSTRFGRPKALLPVAPRGPSFVTALVAAFRDAGIATVFVVGRDDDRSLREVVALADATFVSNDDPDRGQLSSLVTAIDALGAYAVRAIVVVPVDMPLIAAASIAAVRDAFVQRNPPIARATYRGRHGHPVVFGAALFDELRRANPAEGARTVVHAHADEVANVEVEDAAVVKDVDTPADYREVFGRDV
jgi:molybdenum cofactor cytidylyltransferase